MYTKLILALKISLQNTVLFTACTEILCPVITFYHANYKNCSSYWFRRKAL
uniref:Uncharacterized protein n=1 Tax=Anguilla anguilla TaxID=7936 RepID=A0A0E9PWZ3_ANGAN